MASRIIHFIIAKKILEQRNLIYNDFILGNLLPDAHDGTLYGYSHSHFGQIVNGEYSKSSIIEYQRFREKYSVHFNKSIILGYFCHLLSDRMWVQLDKPGIPKNYDIDDKEILALRKRKHEEYGRLNRLLIDYFKLGIPQDIRVPNELVVTEIDRSNILTVCIGIGRDFNNSHTGDLTMFTLEFILDYIDNTVKFCLENI